MSECDMDAMARCAALCDEHEKLKPLEGTFKAEIKMWMGPGDPMVSTGTMVNTLDLGGRYLRQDYKGDPNPGPFPNFEGRGFFGYNTIDKRFEGMWIDNASTMMMTEHGQVDASGKKWEMRGQMTDPGSGQPMRKRSVVTIHDDNSHTMEMFFAVGDGPEIKSMEISYARA